MKKGVFISFCYEDKQLKERLKRKIAKNEILYPIVITERRSPNTLNTEKVKQGLKECDYFLPIITHLSLNNQWVNQEIGFAAALERPFYTLIETGLLNKLKGFINKEIDQPYQFEISTNKKTTRKKFRDQYNKLIHDLEKENQEIIISEIKKEGYNYLSKGRMVTYEKGNWYLLVNNKVHPINDEVSNNYLREKIILYNEDHWISKEKFDTYELGRPIIFKRK